MERPVSAQEMPDIFSAVGNFVVNWAVLEHLLDSMGAVIFHLAGGKAVNHQMQRNLSRKIAFLRRCFKSIGALQPFADEAIEVIAEADRLSDTRHFVVHGIPSLIEEDTGAVIFRKMDLVKDYTMHKETRLAIETAKLLDEGLQCGVLSAAMAPLIHRLMERFVPEDKRHNLPSRIGR